MLGLMLAAFAGNEAIAQKKTLILVRHAEKDVSETADKNDPELSPEGRDRTVRLVQKIKRYKPGAVYSTNFKRTRDTAASMAKLRKLEVQLYDPKMQNELVNKILQSKIKRFLIVGHSNSIPLLANLLIKKEIFKPLDESEYGVIWLIRMNNGQVKKVEILQY